MNLNGLGIEKRRLDDIHTIYCKNLKKMRYWLLKLRAYFKELKITIDETLSFELCESSFLTEKVSEFTKRLAELQLRSTSSDMQSALELISEALVISSCSEKLHEMKAEALFVAAGNEAFQQGRYAEAVEHYTAALSCNVESRPFTAVCFCNRAAAYKAQGQVIDAIADCSLAIALDEEYFKAISRRPLCIK